MNSEKPDYTDKPRFIDQLAVDFVVGEHRYMKLTPAEKHHAVHRLLAQGLTRPEIVPILRITLRSVQRMSEVPPPPILDIDEHGKRIPV